MNHLVIKMQFIKECKLYNKLLFAVCNPRSFFLFLILLCGATPERNVLYSFLIPSRI